MNIILLYISITSLCSKSYISEIPLSVGLICTAMNPPHIVKPIGSAYEPCLYGKFRDTVL